MARGNVESKISLQVKKKSFLEKYLKYVKSTQVLIFLLLESREVLFHTSCLKSSFIDKIEDDRFNLKYFNAYDTFCVHEKKKATKRCQWKRHWKFFTILSFLTSFNFWNWFLWTSYYAAIFGRYQKRLGFWHYFEKRSRRKLEQQVSCWSHAYYVYGIFNGI